MMGDTMSVYTVDARTRLTPEQHARLTALARRRGIPLAVYIRMVLLEHLEQTDQGQPGVTDVPSDPA